MAFGGNIVYTWEFEVNGRVLANINEVNLFFSFLAVLVTNTSTV